MQIDDRTQRLLVDLGIGLLIALMVAATMILGSAVTPLFIYQAF
jgi:hypothetical protein